ncbi:type II toxin-antitoxin system CcdA family antitoxin [Nevskia sp.]|uniref:type II toxin-antitoxin system CcdA family antitoxin n=1 Tax=Nevskia sp. TaxID=1929292 RepID=UPI0025F2C5C5|nr:type II toxin-antitoxin system CcdA family antitoxin [Nevskia sp.]
MLAKTEDLKPARRAVNLSISKAVLEEARAHKLNLSRVLEDALIAKLREQRGRQWQDENREAIAYHRERIARDGMWNKDLISF